jgi:hypothetical protein
MIFYETVVTKKIKGMHIRVPAVFTQEIAARKAFNATVKAAKKKSKGYDVIHCAYFSCEADTKINKDQWLALFLGDSRGTPDDSADLLYVRDLIQKRRCIKEYTYEDL